MIALARQRFPQARFIQADAAGLPDDQVTAIVAVGEVLNHATDLPGFIAWAAAARSRLRPGGVLLVDLAGPTRADPEPRTSVRQGQDYRLEVTVSTDAERRTLTRTITITDLAGTETETHVLHLMDPVEVVAALRSVGFEVTALNGYSADLPFPRGWSGFLGRVILES
jgi:trans-aconitate methyltransferase